jgi:hypothetical protein
MTSKLSTWLVVALAGGAFIAGCGSSSTSTSTTQSTPATTGPAATGTGTSPLTPAQAQQAVSTCKSGVQKESAIPHSVKGKLEKTCEKVASSGTANALRQVAEEACIQLVDASHIPAGAAKQRALSVCKVNTTVGK